MSQRRACRVVGQHRSTQRLAPPLPSTEEAELLAWLRAFATARPSWGGRRAAKQARREGRLVNDKRIQRLWRDEGLKVPYRKRKKRMDYNEHRPHSAHGELTPREFAQAWVTRFQPALA